MLLSIIYLIAISAEAMTGALSAITAAAWTCSVWS